jgi:hypothetical protein
MSATLDTSGLDAPSLPLITPTTRLILFKSVERRLTLYLNAGARVTYAFIILEEILRGAVATCRSGVKLNSWDATASSSPP